MTLLDDTEAGDLGHPSIDPAGDRREWFCVQTQPNKMSVAVQSIRQLPGVECFLPQLQFRRTVRRRPVQVTEPLFPGYLFARFGFRTSLRAVYYSQGVSRVIHFGDHWPIIPEETMLQLKQTVGETGIKAVESPVNPGDEVQINSGPFQNLVGLVNRVFPGKMRIAVLLDFLGRQTMVEIPMNDVRQTNDIRCNVIDLVARKAGK